MIPIGRRNAPPKDENDVDLNKLAVLIGIPPTYAHKTLDDFEGDEDKELLEKYIENIHQMFEDKINLMFSGANGSGKTLSASLILKYAVLNYYTARLINFKSYISLLYKKNKTDQEIEKLEKIQECEFLCIDELGKETETESENEKTVLLEIIKKREVEGLVTITCFNIPFKHLEDRYGKTFCDTIVNSSVKVEFGTKSKRKDALKQKKAYKILAGEYNEEDN